MAVTDLLVLCFFYAVTIFASGKLAGAQKDGSGGAAAAGELWCVAKNNAQDSVLQTALDWACGQGGANCSPIQRGGPCYDASDIQRTASFAFNDYYLKHGMTEDSCNFSNSADVTSLNPSYGSCKFPSSKSAINGNVSGSVSSGGGSGPAVDDSSSSSYLVSASRWMWSFIIIHTLFTISRRR
ncbi:OLC1v1023819C1 [Oldenlandia corymbosa var. corymbosa]|uniref:OLC1v1023819C1 n=1 Tax=Oldenlandia corymbosa var. corymbosa TaxID=529605 RepID=A0AAV1C1K7_OLDCO|nr:OLC1v1023819C1 [Oldenlandia corymbosa var. corymbosa]